MSEKQQDITDISSLLLKAKASMSEAIAAVDRGHAQIALVIDDDGRLLGTVTDGDIRRALLRGQSLDSPVENVMNRSCRVLPSSANEDAALALMRREMLHQIPVVDDQGRVVRLFLIRDLLHSRKLANPVVIMAGGEGKRLRPLTEDCPKPMLRVGGKPLLEIILQHCIDSGFCDFYLSVNYLKQQIKEHFGDGSRWGVSIRFLEEKQPLGTAGALSLLPQRPSVPMLVINGDVLTRVDFSRMLRFHVEHKSAATLCVRDHLTEIPYGVVRTDDVRVLDLEEKPVLSHYVNAGIYLLNPEVFDLLPAGQFFDMPELLGRAVQHRLLVTAFPIHEYWLDIGHPETLERALGEWQ